MLIITNEMQRNTIFFTAVKPQNNNIRYTGPIRQHTNTRNTQNRKINADKEENRNKKWAVFTYYNPRIRKPTNLFKHTNICIAFRSTNTIQQYIKTKTPNHTPKTQHEWDLQNHM